MNNISDHQALCLHNTNWFKGQLNSEWIYEVMVSHKIPTKNYKDFCPVSLLKGRAEIIVIFGWHLRRNDDLINSFWIQLTFSTYPEYQQYLFLWHQRPRYPYWNIVWHHVLLPKEWKAQKAYSTSYPHPPHPLGTSPTWK